MVTRSERLVRTLDLADRIEGLGFDRIAKNLRSEALARADRESLVIPGERKLIFNIPLDTKKTLAPKPNILPELRKA